MPRESTDQEMYQKIHDVVTVISKTVAGKSKAFETENDEEMLRMRSFQSSQPRRREPL